MALFYRVMVFPCMMMLCVGSTAFARLPVNKQGRVNMQGSIMDAACAIATDNLEQTVDMSVITTSGVVQGGKLSQRHFSLHLVNCSVKPQAASQKNSGWFQVTFDGPADGNVFSVNRDSRVGLKIMDAAGNIAIPGEPMPGVALAKDEQRLDYTLRLTSHQRRIKADELHSALRFRVDYF